MVVWGVACGLRNAPKSSLSQEYRGGVRSVGRGGGTVFGGGAARWQRIWPTKELVWDGDGAGLGVGLGIGVVVGVIVTCVKETAEVGGRGGGEK